MIEERHVTDQCASAKPSGENVSADRLRRLAKSARMGAQEALRMADLYEAAADQIKAIPYGPLHELVNTINAGATYSVVAD